MIGAGLLALLSHWRRNPLQLLTLLGGLALATGLWSAVQAINAEARASYAAAAATLGEGRFAQITGDIDEAAYVALRRAGWLVSPVVDGRLDGIRIVGIEPLTAPGGIGPMSLTGADAGFLQPPGRLHARPEVLAALAGILPDGGPVPVAAPDVAPGTAITDIGVAQRLLGMEGRITRLIVAPDQPLGQRPLAGIAPGLTLRPPAQGNDLARLTESFHLNLTAFGLLAFAVGIFIVHGAVGLAFAQRRPVIRTLRALGLPLRLVVGLMAAELALLALVAGAIGIGLGYAIAAALLPDVALSLRGLYGAEIAGTLAFRPVWWLSGLGIALGGTALAAGRSLWQVARLPLLAAPQAVAARARWGRMAALAALLLALAGVLVATADGLLAGFALLACLMLGAALALPPLLSLVLRLAGARARGPVAQWFWADSRQQLPALSLALMALLLALAANIGVATMVSSFRLTFVAFLDQRLASELYVTAESPAQAARIAAFAETRAAAVLPIMTIERPLAGQPAEVYGARDHATYRDNWRFLEQVPGLWDRLAAGEGTIVNEQLARRAGLRPGDRLDVGVSLPVLGIYGDYGNPVGQAVIAEALFVRLYPEAPALRFGLRAAPGGIAPLRAALTDDLGLAPGAITDQAAIKALSLSIFERTFAVTGALNVLTLAVAGFAMLMSLLTLATMRLPQLAPVWALGLTRRDLARIEFLRALALAALTGLFALPAGLALAWALLAVVNVAAFGWQLPIHLFPLDYLRLFLLSLLAAALAAAWPALRLRRTPPARLLKVFADER